MLFECRVRNRRKNVFFLHYRTITTVNCRNTLKQHSSIFQNTSEHGTDEWTMEETVLGVPAVLSTRTALLIPQESLSIPCNIQLMFIWSC